MVTVNFATSAITAVVTLLGVALGGWLTTRNQERLWRRDHARQWRDIRLSTYSEFLTAYRQYIAFALEPTARISAVPHPRRPDELMPFFDETGRPYREKFEGAMMAVRLVSDRPATSEAAGELINRARHIASARATHSAQDIPNELFEDLWRVQTKFMVATRSELGLSDTSPETDM
jgi:hypothetical protein